MKYSKDIFTHYTDSVSSFVKFIYELSVVTVCSINSQHIASPNQLHTKQQIKKKKVFSKSCCDLETCSACPR